MTEISRQPNTDCVTWLLAITLAQVYNKKEFKQGKKKIQNAHLEEKEGTRKYNVIAKDKKKNKEIEKRSGLHWDTWEHLRARP